LHYTYLLASGQHVTSTFEKASSLVPKLIYMMAIQFRRFY